MIPIYIVPSGEEFELGKTHRYNCLYARAFEVARMQESFKFFGYYCNVPTQDKIYYYSCRIDTGAFSTQRECMYVNESELSTTWLSYIPYIPF